MRPKVAISARLSGDGGLTSTIYRIIDDGNCVDRNLVALCQFL